MATVQTEMGMSLSVLRVDRFTSPIPIPRRRSFVTAVAVQTETGTGESVSAPSRSFHHHLLRFHYHFLPWRSLIAMVGEALKDEERVAEDL